MLFWRFRAISLKVWRPIDGWGSLAVSPLQRTAPMKAYSDDLRQRVLADCDAGLPTAEVAAKHRVSAGWVRRLKQRRRETGETAPRKQRHGSPPKWAEHAEAIRASVREAPDATLEEHRQRLGLDVGVSTLWRAIKALGPALKKKS